MPPSPSSYLPSDSKGAGHRSCLFPIRQRSQFAQDFLQSLKSALVIRCAGRLSAALHVLEVFFVDLCDLFSQVGDALLDGWCHALSDVLSFARMKVTQE
jgi:hypothetical protein